jgi:hypothetical protein
MVDPITLALLGAVFGGLVGAGLAVLTARSFYDWFSARRHWLRNGDFLGASIMQRLHNGTYRTVQGVFNRYDELIDSREIYSDEVERDLWYMHRSGRIVYFDY